ncbi:MAG TPA: T9SS type A sorting domain-containing protein [Bacteroidales bacterium]|nr:T9SS type A sorting domain-containing protein [Bacteroidales bacterium]HRZ20319.1 T9SS type A sorting domain-containing protein [Bacteroidales bacterium]
MKINVFFLFLFIASAAFSQTFVTTIRTELDEVAGKPLELDDGSFLVPMARGTYDPIQPELYDYQEYIFKVSPDGIVTDSAIIDIESAFTSGSLKLLHYNDQVFFWSTIRDTTESGRPGGLRYGLLSDDLEVTQETILFSADTGRTFHDCMVNIFNNLVFVGIEVDWSTQNQTNIIWEINPSEGIIRQGGLDDDMVYFREIIDLHAVQKYHICGIARNCQFNYNLDFEGMIFIQPMEDTIFEYHASQLLTDSTYARCAIGFEFPPSDFQDFGIGIFNDSGQKQKTYTLGVPGTNDYAISLDCNHPDSLIVGGTLGGPLATMDKKFEVINFRPSSGEVNWQFYYGDSGAYEVSSVLTTRDGGCLIAGTWWDGLNYPYMERDVILIKVNRQGQLVDIEERFGSQFAMCHVYPNPGWNTLYVTCGLDAGEFELFDSFGQKVVSRTYIPEILIIDTSGLPKGLFFYRIIFNDKNSCSGTWIKQ